MAVVDQVLVCEIEELMAIGMRYDPMILLVQENHRVRYAEAHGLTDEMGKALDSVEAPGASERTIQRHMKRIRERWAKEEEEERPNRRKELRMKLNAVFQKAYMEGGQSLSSAVQCLRIGAKIDGLEAPQQIEVNGQLDIKAMSPDERQKRINELWIKRQAALGKPVVDVLTAPAPKKLKAKKAIKATAKPKKTPAKAKKATAAKPKTKAKKAAAKKAPAKRAPRKKTSK